MKTMLLTGRKQLRPRRPKAIGLSKRKRELLKTSRLLAQKIVLMLRRSGVSVTENQYLTMKDRIFSNKGRFTPSILTKAGLANRYVAQQIMSSLIVEDEATTARTDVGKFDQEMEGFFRRMERGNFIGLAFLRMRASSVQFQHAVHVRLQNHWQLDRVLEHVERLEFSENKQVIGGLFYHTVIDGLHLDCVPLNTKGLPVEWVISVKIPDCDCKCANWEKTPFLGSDWT